MASFGQSNSPQYFTAPVHGMYAFSLNGEKGVNGAKSGSTGIGGSGRNVTGVIELQKNQSITLLVGSDSIPKETISATYWNVGRGGRRTVIKFSDSNEIIAVAAGGGGGRAAINPDNNVPSVTNGGNAGGLVGGSVSQSSSGLSTGGTQTSNGTETYYATQINGGYGYYNGGKGGGGTGIRSIAGAGGSSYVSPKVVSGNVDGSYVSTLGATITLQEEIKDTDNVKRGDIDVVAVMAGDREVVGIRFGNVEIY